MMLLNQMSVKETDARIRIDKMLNDAGFDNTRVVNLLEDVATIHIGQKS